MAVLVFPPMTDHPESDPDAGAGERCCTCGLVTAGTGTCTYRITVRVMTLGGCCTEAADLSACNSLFRRAISAWDPDISAFNLSTARASDVGVGLAGVEPTCAKGLLGADCPTDWVCAAIPVSDPIVAVDVSGESCSADRPCATDGFADVAVLVTDDKADRADDADTEGAAAFDDFADATEGRDPDGATIPDVIPVPIAVPEGWRPLRTDWVVNGAIPDVVGGAEN